MSDDRYWCVDENLNVLTGDAARVRLQALSDACYLDPELGIAEVPKSRWQVAQDCERLGWLGPWAGASDDRNLEHMRDFGGYRALRGLSFHRAIELGCGPFTNLRLIDEVCCLDGVTLADPLIEAYLSHPHCRYTRTDLVCERHTHLARLLGTSLISRGVRKVVRATAPRLLLSQRRVPIRELIAKPIEEMPDAHGAYDLVVIINVLEHCYSASSVFERILEMLAPEGYLVFHDKLYSSGRVAQMVNGHYYEAAHPLMIDAHLVDGFLDREFSPVFRSAVTKEFRDPASLLPSYDGLFYIGKRLPGPGRKTHGATLPAP